MRANCAHCHAIDKVSPSPLAIAPPFRDLAPALSGREPAGSVRRGISDRPPEHAGIPARPGPDRRRDRLPQDARSDSRAAGGAIDLDQHMARRIRAPCVHRIAARRGGADERGRSWRQHDRTKSMTLRRRRHRRSPSRRWRCSRIVIARQGLHARIRASTPICSRPAASRRSSRSSTATSTARPSRRRSSIDGKPNYNMGPVKFATVAAMFWGIAGFTVGL